MKIILTGSLGHIGRPLTENLVQKGHAVTVISSKAEKKSEIEKSGAAAAIGTLTDTKFLQNVFTGADVVYTMVPPGNYFDKNFDLKAYYHTIGHSYAEAIRQAGVMRVVNLSTIGGNMKKGNGILRYAHDVEEILNDLPAEVTIIQVRPTSFYYNLYGYVEMIKAAGSIITNYGDSKIPWVAPLDIAAVVADEITSSFSGRKARYVASEELTGQESARIFGAAIGKPDLSWLVVSDEEVLHGMESIGMNPAIAAGLVEMYAGLQSGLLAEDYFRNRPEVLGKVKLADFAKEFAMAFS